jgi:isocitrate dehydrogenase
MRLPPLKPPANVTKTRVGVDVNLNWDGDIEALVDMVMPCVNDDLELTIISNRGVAVWPEKQPDTFCADNYRLRFMGKDGAEVRTSAVVALLQRLNEQDMNFTKAVMLHTFDGQPGFSAAQGA